jgi:hypothetical protein
VCSGDEALFAWVMGWFAQLVQRPDRTSSGRRSCSAARRAPARRSSAGSSAPARPHYALVADSRYIVGRFNAHLANCLMLQLDEATWGGDHAAAGKLKDLITGDYQYIEYKGKEPVTRANYVRLLVTGNNNWLVPAGSRNAASPCSTSATRSAEPQLLPGDRGRNEQRRPRGAAPHYLLDDGPERTSRCADPAHRGAGRAAGRSATGTCRPPTKGGSRYERAMRSP